MRLSSGSEIAVHCRCDVLDHRWLRGTGCETARWLVRRGAKHLVLTGRRPPNAFAVDCIRELESLGVTIRVFQADAGARDRMQFVYDYIQNDMPPLRGVVHAAGAIRDAALLNQRWKDAPEIFDGKVGGAWLLHELTRGLPLEFFILYSAAGVLLGAAGQGLYSAANAELDALAHFRQRLGLPALSVRGDLGRMLAWLLTLPPAGAMSGKHVDFAKLNLPMGLTNWNTSSLTKSPMPLSCQLIGPAFLPNCRRMPIATSSTLSLVRLRQPRRPSDQAGGILESLRAMPPAQRRTALISHLTERTLQALGLERTTSIELRIPLKELDSTL